MKKELIKQNIEQQIDKLEAEIMDWIYKIADINFDVKEWIQDSSELREIIKRHFTKK